MQVDPTLGVQCDRWKWGPNFPVLKTFPLCNITTTHHHVARIQRILVTTPFVALPHTNHVADTKDIGQFNSGG